MKIKNETVVCVAFIAASVLCVATGHAEAACWFGLFAFLAWTAV